MPKESLIPEEMISNKIFFIRNQKVMIDRYLANLYGVETKYLKRQVRRNIDRFPDDFMFEQSNEELNVLRSQFGTSSWGGNRYTPMAFTKQGVAMLSSVINSPKAIAVNIKIIRVFTKLRELLSNDVTLQLEIETIKRKLTQHSKNIELVFNYLDELTKKEETQRTKIGYKKD